MAVFVFGVFGHESSSSNTPSDEAPRPPGTPEDNLLQIWTEIRQWWHDRRITGTFVNMHLGMFTNKRNPNAKFAKLRGRAAEIKKMGAPLLHVWASRMDPESVPHGQIKMMLQASVKLEEMLEDHAELNKYTPSIHDEFMQACDKFLVLSTAVARFYADEGLKVFDIVPKHHLLWHACHMSQFLNPRRSWCYSGEDYMQHMRKLAQSCLRGTPSWMVSQKMTRKFARAFVYRFLARERWFLAGAASASSA